MARIRTDGAFGAELTIDGLEATRNGLDELEPSLRRKLDRDLKSTVGTVAEAASREVDTRSPSSGTAAGYRVERRRSGFRIVNKTRGAAILEFAAIPHCPQGAALIGTLNEKYGRPGRIMWGSWDALEPYVLDRVRQIVEDAEFELERRLAGVAA